MADRLQNEANAVLKAYDVPLQPAQQLVLAALLIDGPQPVGELAQRLRVSQPTITRSVAELEALGFIGAARAGDQRQKILSLTPAGTALMQRNRNELWPRVARAMTEVCGNNPNQLLEILARMEAELDATSLLRRVDEIRATTCGLKIRDFDDGLAETFFRLNTAWIEEMFSIEQADLDILRQPRSTIIDKGGIILFADTDDLGIVGTCALMPSENGWWELTKMCVSPAARGRKIGEYLLVQALWRARSMGLSKLFLLTNWRCEAAIHLYEKLGFRHDALIMEQFGSHYARCNVAMAYQPD